MNATLPAVLADQATTLVAEDIAARLEDHARQAAGALAPETERALRKASGVFSRWAAAQGVTALPATPATVAAYVGALTRLGRRPATIRQAIWAIATLHRAAGCPDPSDTNAVRLALRRMSRALGCRQRQAAPLGEDEVERILASAGTGTAALRDRALLLTMRDLLARRSEAVALEVADLCFAADGSATALIRRSKTDQSGLGEVRWLSC